MKSRMYVVAVVCLTLSGLALARGFDVSHFGNQMFAMDDLNDPTDPNGPVDPNKPVDIPE